jgi:hypothetical protein
MQFHFLSEAGNAVNSFGALEIAGASGISLTSGQRVVNYRNLNYGNQKSWLTAIE